MTQIEAGNNKPFGGISKLINRLLVNITKIKKRAKQPVFSMRNAIKTVQRIVLAWQSVLAMLER